MKKKEKEEKGRKKAKRIVKRGMREGKRVRGMGNGGEKMKKKNTKI